MVLMAIVIAAAVLVGCGSSSGGKEAEETGARTSSESSPREKPGEFLKQILLDGYRGDFGRMWDRLHPEVKKVISRQRFIECSSQYQNPVDLISVAVHGVRDQPISAPGIPERRSKAVELALTVSKPGGQPFVVRSTLHAILVRGAWVWIPKPDDLKAYAAGACQSSTPSG
jgi:hypothetical protein